MRSEWKKNWEESREHFVDWWKHDGLVLGCWDLDISNTNPLSPVEKPDVYAKIEDRYRDPHLFSRLNHYRLANSHFPADILPISYTNLGPGSLSLYLGCTPDFSNDTVWYKPCWHKLDDPEELPTLVFDSSNYWWKITEEILKSSIEIADGRYFAGCPDLVENIDILSSLRDSQLLMMDMIERPQWVEKKIGEINRVYFDVYDRVYQIIKQDDGGACFGPFRIWGPGKTAKVQCDASAMFSPDMFRQFALSALKEQCSWLDYSMYHLDGTQAICHLDAILEIEDLDAVEWTPQAGIEDGGNERWYPMYRKILASGKSLQVINVLPNEIKPLLNAIGTKGVYIHGIFHTLGEVQAASELVEQYR